MQFNNFNLKIENILGLKVFFFSVEKSYKDLSKSEKEFLNIDSKENISDEEFLYFSFQIIAIPENNFSIILQYDKNNMIESDTIDSTLLNSLVENKHLKNQAVDLTKEIKKRIYSGI